MEPTEVPIIPDPPDTDRTGAVLAELLARTAHMEALLVTLVGKLDQYEPLLTKAAARVNRPAPFGLRGFTGATMPTPGR